MPPTIPAMHWTTPQFENTNVPDRPMPLPKVLPHWRIACRRNPLHSSMIATVMITGLVKMRAITRHAFGRSVSCELASPGSKSLCPVSDGLSNTNRNDSTKNTTSITAGMMNSQCRSFGKASVIIWPPS